MNVLSISKSLGAPPRGARLAGLSLVAALASFSAIGVAHAGDAAKTAKCAGNSICFKATNTGGGIGLVGISTQTGVGVVGNSSSGTGIEGYSSSGFGSYGSSTTGWGSYSTSGGLPAIGGYNNDGNGDGNGADITGGYIGIIGRSSTFPLALTDLSGNNLVFVDGVGDIYYHGSLNTFLRTKLGGTATAYGPKSTASTLEHVGSGRLINGQAVVNLDPAFAQSIDASSPYHVFVTPGGDNRGLFVTAKTPSSFVVRESQGGRSTLDFDYRIVATTFGHASDRTALVNPAKLAQPHAAIVPRPKAH